MANNLAIIGAGAWGSALAIALSGKFEKIWLYAHTAEEANTLKPQHSALGVPYSDNIEILSDPSELSQVNDILLAVPSYGFSSTLETIKPHLGDQHQLAWVTKGFDPISGGFLHESFERILPNKQACVISGPSFAFEVAEHKPTAVVVASNDTDTREYFSELIQTQSLRAYTNADLVGVEVGGSVKNILAIAAGIASGLGFGANTQAALITRGLAEMTRLGLALGADKATFMGLSGLGDLVLTCSDDLSRNRRFGKELAKGHNIKQALDNVGATVEGLNALELVLSIANQHQIEMPICEQVYAVVQGQISPTEAVSQLMSREQTGE